MKKSIITLTAAALMAVTMSITSFAGYWTADRYENWHYINDDGSYLIDGWYWINEKCYYFKDYAVYTNTTTPDGYTVDATGAWTVDGVVQIKAGENLDYCKNIQDAGGLPDSPVVITKSVTDCGDYYDAVAEIYPVFPVDGWDVPYKVAHIRIRKSANVHWYTHSDSNDTWTATEMSLEEYANREGWNKPLSFVRMVDGIVQDSEGYVIAFSDARGN